MPTRTRVRRALGRTMPAALLLALALGVAHAATELAPRPLPEFPDRRAEAWLNSAPLSRTELAGKVVLIEVWNTT